MNSLCQVGNFNYYFFTYEVFSMGFSFVKCCDNYFSSFSSGIKARVMLICFWQIPFTADKISQNTSHNYQWGKISVLCISVLALYNWAKTTGKHRRTWKALGSGTGIPCCRGILHTMGIEEYCGIQNYLYFDPVSIWNH